MHAARLKQYAGGSCSAPVLARNCIHPARSISALSSARRHQVIIFMPQSFPFKPKHIVSWCLTSCCPQACIFAHSAPSGMRSGS